MGTWKTDAFSSSTSLGNFLGNYSGKLSKGCGGMELEINLGDAISPGASLHPSLVIEPGGMSKTLSVRNRLSLTREGKLQWKVCLYPHLEQ